MNEGAAVFVYVLKPGDAQAGADGDSINSGKLNDRPKFAISFGSLTGDAVLTMKSGATEGTKTTSEKFRYALAVGVQGATDGDKFPAWTTGVTSLTLTAATYQNKLLIVEIETMTTDQEWATLELGSEASALNVSIVALVDRRWKTEDGVPSLIK